MKINIWFVLQIYIRLLLSITTRALGEDCSVTVTNFVAAFEVVGDKLLHLPIKLNTFQIPVNKEIFLICPVGFEQSLFDDNSKHTTAKLFCDTDGYLKYSPYNSNAYQKRYYNDFSCPSDDFQLHIEPSRVCHQTNFVVTLDVMDQTVTLVEICFDLQLLKLEFVHYIRNQHIHVVERNLVPSTLTVRSYPVNSPGNYFLKTFEDIRLNLKEGFDLGSAFTRSFLVDLEQITPFNESSFSNIKDLVRITWLRSLKEGYTLKVFKKLLEQRSNEVLYDVYVGVSGVVNVPESFKSNCENTTQTRIPLYIWHYLKPRTLSEKEFVVISVNSPFVEADVATFKICADICGDVPWLEGLEHVRKISNLGYLFCCGVDEVRSILDGFPKFAA